MTTTIGTRLPSDAVERVTRARTARERAESSRIRHALAAIRDEHRRHHATILPPDFEQRLRDHAAATPTTAFALSDADRLRRRAAERAYAVSLGIDLAALARLQVDTRERIAAAVRPRPVDGSVLTLPYDAGSPDPAVAAGPWHGAWDSGTSWWSTAAYRTTWLVDQTNHEPATNRSGSHLMLTQRHGGGDADVHATRTSGFLLSRTMPVTGRVSVSFTATRAFGRHFCDNDDEPGWSDCWTEVAEHGVVEVYHDWDDPDAGAAGGQLLLDGVRTDDTEAWVDTPGVLPGSARSVRLTTDVTVPAGSPVLVFVATRQSVLASLDDVTTTLGVDGAWHLGAPAVLAV